MAESTKSQTFEVVLNAGAMGLDAGQNVKEVKAARFVRDPNGQGTTFFDADDNEVAFFQYATSVMPKS